MYQILENDEWKSIQGEPQEGQKYRELNAGGGYVESIWANSGQVSFNVANELIKINGDDPVPRTSFFSAMLNDNIIVTSEIVDGSGNVQTQIDQTAMGMPPVLLVPFQKFAGGKNGTLIDETHLKASIVSGVVTIEGIPPSAGNWVMQENRMNQSLKSIGATFYIKSGDLNIVILNEVRPQ